MSEARNQIRTREQVARLLADGLGRSEIARRLGIGKSTVSYHASRLGETIDERCARRYDWPQVQLFYDAGHSMRECRARFGFSSHTWHAAVKRGLIVSRPAGLPPEELFISGTYRCRHNLKSRLLRSGLKENRCEECGIDAWRELPLSLCLHHVNGDGNDHRLENLQLLCPNCHSQTPNFSGRNAYRRNGKLSAR